MEEDRPLTREEIEDILDRFHIQEYEWFIVDEEDEFCSSSEEDAELVEKAIKSLINQYKTDYISKDKIRDKIKELKECRMRAISDIGLQIFNAEISMLEQLLED